MTAKPIMWRIDDETTVEIDDGETVTLRQNGGEITFCPTGASINEAIDALFAASVAMGYTLPDSICDAQAEATEDALSMHRVPHV